MKKYPMLTVLVLLAIFLGACKHEPEVVYVEITSTSEPTKAPTETPLPINTPVPTNTPIPTDTPEPTPTEVQCNVTIEGLENNYSLNISEDESDYLDSYDYVGIKSLGNLNSILGVNLNQHSCVYEAGFYTEINAFDNNKDGLSYIIARWELLGGMMDEPNSEDGLDFVNEKVDLCETEIQGWSKDFLDTRWEFACTENDDKILMLLEILTNRGK